MRCALQATTACMACDGMGGDGAGREHAARASDCAKDCGPCPPRGPPSRLQSQPLPPLTFVHCIYPSFPPSPQPLLSSTFDTLTDACDSRLATPALRLGGSSSRLGIIRDEVKDSEAEFP
ncbi:hypothetical protein MPTK2_1g00580 [Marchantia polymorpha subsp. ruderalis]